MTERTFVITDTASIAVPRMPKWLLAFWPCKVYKCRLRVAPKFDVEVDDWTET